MNLLLLEPVVPSVFVIVMLYWPVVAPAGITKVPVICVGETTLTLVRVIVVEARVQVTVAPGWNPDPVMVRPGAVPRVPVAGTLLVNVGFAALMVNARVPDDCPSALVTMIFHAPEVVPKRLNVQVIWVGDTTVTPVAMMSEYPARVIFTVAPGWNPVPVRVTLTGHPLFAEVGALTERAGAAPVTVNPLASVPVSEYGLVTVTLRFAAVAPVRSKIQVIWVAETRLTFVAMISGPAELLTSLTTAPVRKFVPLIRSITVQPRTWVIFVIAVTVGSGLFTKNPRGRLTGLAVGIGDHNIPEAGGITEEIELGGDQIRGYDHDIRSKLDRVASHDKSDIHPVLKSGSGYRY